MFDDKTWEKTIAMAINKHLLNFMEISFAGHRSSKMWGRKKRYLEFATSPMSSKSTRSRKRGFDVTQDHLGTNTGDLVGDEVVQPYI
jgi:hypothetical protein